MSTTLEWLHHLHHWNRWLLAAGSASLAQLVPASRRPVETLARLEIGLLFCFLWPGRTAS